MSSLSDRQAKLCLSFSPLVGHLSEETSNLIIHIITDYKFALECISNVQSPEDREFFKSITIASHRVSHETIEKDINKWMNTTVGL